MRFFLKKSSPSKKGLYLQIYRTNYVPGKGNQNKSFKALGYVSDLISMGIDDPIAYAKKMIDDLNKDFDIKKNQQIGEFSTMKNVGYFLPKAMFDLLDMDAHLNIVASSYKSHYVFSDFFRTLTYAQIVGPGSKHYLFDKIIPSLFDLHNYSYDQILDGINFIGSDFHKYIEVLNHHIANIYHRNLNIALFDCTNYYFEIDEDLALAGYNLLITSEIDADARDIYAAYHNLWRIEHSFRVMKTHLEARPVFVSNRDTIFGHFLIVYTALVIMRLIEFKVFNDDIPIEQLFDFIRDYNISENYDGTFINNATASKTYLKIKEKLGLSKLGNVYLSHRDIKLLLDTEF